MQLSKELNPSRLLGENFLATNVVSLGGHLVINAPADPKSLSPSIKRAHILDEVLF